MLEAHASVLSLDGGCAQEASYDYRTSARMGFPAVAPVHKQAAALTAAHVGAQGLRPGLGMPFPYDSPKAPCPAQQQGSPAAARV